MSTHRTPFVRLSFVLLIALAGSAATIEGQPPARTYPSSRRPLELNAYLAPSPGATPWAPAWSPDGRSIAAGMHGSIWKIDVSTGVAEELTYNQKYHGSPAWSPDGQWIVYTADDGGSTIQLEVVNVATGKSEALTADEFVYTDPAFSPDGTRVAYVSTNPTGSLHVYVRAFKEGAFAGPPIAITHTASGPPTGAGAPVYLEPAWSRDGKDLLVVSNRNIRDIPGAGDLANSLAGEILRVPAVANGIEQARTIVTLAESYFRARPDVSVDGTRLVFASTRGSADRYHNLYFQPLAGGDPAKITFFAHDAFQPRWSPDGEWIAYNTNENGLPQLALMETFYGASKTLKIADYRWKRPIGRLSVRTVDAATNRVVASRIHLGSSDGKFYAPNDAFALVGRTGERAFHSTGAFTVSVPPGSVHLTAVRGFEYQPASVDVDVRAGAVTEVTVPLKRISDIGSRGWHNGSMHSHMNYEGSFNQTPESYFKVAAAEDEDVVTTHTVDYGSRILDNEYFTAGGQAHPQSTRDRLLIVGQEPRPPLYGHLGLFGLKDHLMTPIRWGGTGGSSLYPTPTDIFKRARTQGATVGYDHSFGGDNDPLAGNLGQAAGLLVDAALGTADFLTWNNAARAGFYPLYAAWNNGLKLTAIGGEDAIVNAQNRRAISGSTRTYVFLGTRPLAMSGWLEAVRAGHAFVTTGPLISLTINRAIPGDELTLPKEGGDVQVDATVRSITPLDKVLLVFNGVVIEDIPISADRRSADFRKSIHVTQSGWFHLRAEGRPTDRFPLDADYAQAFTNATWVKVGSNPIRSRDAAEYGGRWVDKLQQMATTLGLWRSDEEKRRTLAVFDEARQIYRRLAAEASSDFARQQ
jgi:TolB protein